MQNKYQYSIILLKEAHISTIKTAHEHKLFEESIIIIESEKDLLENKTDFINYIDYLIAESDEDYLNEFEEIVSWRREKIIDVFELTDKVRIEEKFAEVYSRFLEMPVSASVQDVIDKFYSDYVWEDDDR